jgi:dihydrofolate reductase
MIVSLIVAKGKNGVIGKNNQMMWHLPLEFKYFKETTLGHCIVSGRKNYEAIGSPLPKRENIIITRNKDYAVDGAVVVHSLNEALEHAKSKGESEVFICGGGQIYSEAISLVDRMYITEVDYQDEGDVYFPDFNEDDFSKKLVQAQEVSEKNKYAWNAYVYERK